ncbi:ECF RNA polymerase sigma factor SigW [Candidatus Thermoflexus japonica]|uniref:ECF RNA polymerase sigma factor SigW n=1 Tax=Candidatus Thermoflexus japonica TaxID=2035417 RepID=A0A2H5Y5P2_9CHLR|nr:ECF RNA polymerase sigma factor SigW [Candidatus Thermoflexus japonica]
MNAPATHPESEEERRWLLAARAGDLEAFERLIAVYTRPIYNLAYRMLGDPQEAEDATQEIFLRIYRGLATYDPQRPPASWILSIAAHYCIDQLRARRPSVPLEDLESKIVAPSRDHPESVVERRDQEEQIQQALLRLSHEDRMVLVLYYWHERSCEEIASILGVSREAVRVRLHRARLRLAEHLYPLVHAGDPPSAAPSPARRRS